MHLPVSAVGRIDNGETAVDLALPPADVVFLSAADTELALVTRVAEGSGLSITAVNLGRLEHPLSVDLFLEKTVLQSRCVVLRLMGGYGRWRYLAAEVRRTCRAQGVPLISAPGEDQWDTALARAGALRLFSRPERRSSAAACRSAPRRLLPAGPRSGCCR
jgi:cobaltochelatase CobN